MGSTMNLDILNNLDSIKEFISSFIEVAQEFIVSLSEFIQSSLGDSTHSVVLFIMLAIGFFIVFKIIKFIVQLVTYIVVISFLGLVLYSYKYFLN